MSPRQLPTADRTDDVPFAAAFPDSPLWIKGCLAVHQRRSGCGCLFGLLFLGALVGGPTILGKTQDTVQTAPATSSAGSGPTSSAPAAGPTAGPTTVARKTVPKATAPKTAAPKAPRAPLPLVPAPETVAPAKPRRTTAAEAAPAPAAYYPNCAAARAAGAAPLLVGEPGYRPALDRDKDGVACET